VIRLAGIAGLMNPARFVTYGIFVILIAAEMLGLSRHGWRKL